jgi:hypothetical protein
MKSKQASTKEGHLPPSCRAAHASKAVCTHGTAPLLWIVAKLLHLQHCCCCCYLRRLMSMWWSERDQHQ